MRLLTRRALVGGLAGLSTVAASAAWGLAIEPGRLVVTEYRLDLSGWPADRPFSIAVLADLHANVVHMPLDRVAGIVAVTNALKPDLVLLAGDYHSSMRFGAPVAMAPLAEVLSALSAPLGVFAVLGNHDWWFDGGRSARATFAARGIVVLENEAVRLDPGFWLLGLGDQLAHRLGGKRYAGVDDLPGTLRKVTDDAPAILLAHEPDVFVRVPPRVALTVSGHTHGGQVWLPGVGPLIVPSDFGDRFAYGHVVEDRRHLIVSGGLGFTGIPVRFGVPPEIVMIRLGEPPLV